MEQMPSWLPMCEENTDREQEMELKSIYSLYMIICTVVKLCVDQKKISNLYEGMKDSNINTLKIIGFRNILIYDFKELHCK